MTLLIGFVLYIAASLLIKSHANGRNIGRFYARDVKVV